MACMVKFVKFIFCRYGKPLVLDMMEVDMLEACERRFDEVQKGLLSAIFNKSILTRDV